MKRYIDIDSSRRNRTLYPKPSDFVIQVNGTYNNSPDRSQDPILLAFPYEANQLSGGSTFTQLALSVTSSNIINFYRNSYIEIFGNFRRIIDYDNFTQIAIVDIPFPVAYPALTPYTIRKDLPNEVNTTGGVAANNYTIVLNAASLLLTTIIKTPFYFFLEQIRLLNINGNVLFLMMEQLEQRL